MNQSLPYNEAAERATIGAIFLEPDIAPILQDLVQPEDFYSEKLGRVYAAQLACLKQRTRPDMVSVGAMLHGDDIDVPFLMDLANAVPSAYNAHVYAGIVHKCAVLRRLIQVGGRIAALGYEANDDVDGTLADAQALLNAVEQQATASAMVSADAVVDDLDFEQSEVQSGKMTPGFVTSLHDLNRHIGSFRRKELTTLLSPSGTGKSTMMGQLIAEVAEPGGHAGAFSLEMDRKVFFKRILARWFHTHYQELGITYDMLRDWRFVTPLEVYRVKKGEADAKKLAQLETERMIAVEEGKAYLRSLNISISDARGLTVDQIRLQALRRVAQHGPFDFFAIDYGQLVLPTGQHRNREQAVAEVADQVLTLAADLDCPLLCLAQENKQGEVRESMRWHNNCHVELRLQRREDEAGMVDLFIPKARDGITNTQGIPLVFSGAHQCFLSHSPISIEGY